METLFNDIKAHFEEHLNREKNKSSRSNGPHARLPNSSLCATTSPADLFSQRDNTVRIDTTNKNQRPSPKVASAPRDMLADGDSAHGSSSFEVAALPSRCSTVNGAVIGAKPEAQLLPQGGAIKPEKAHDLNKISISEIMCSDEIVECAGNASRAFWQDAADKPASEWHSMALFLKDHHSALFPSAPPLPPPSPTPPPTAPSPSS